MWQHVKGIITTNKEIMTGHYKLSCLAPAVALPANPGQFVHLQVTNQADPLLRRPISIFHVDKLTGEISLVYRVVGKGTKILAQKKPGEEIDMLGPLGNGFQLPAKPESSLLVVGGGIGLAPLQYLTCRLIELGHQVILVAGLRNNNQLPLLEHFAGHGFELVITTEDGSFGKKGLVTAASEQLLADQQVDFIYACGPEGMLKTVAEQGEKYHVPCQVSLERTMACGVGACLGCTCETTKAGQLHFSHVCKDGPVFWGNEVLFRG